MPIKTLRYNWVNMRAVVVFLSIVVVVVRGTTVLTKHGFDLLPSSTLRWRHVVKANLKNAIQVDPNEWNTLEPESIRYVCRSLHHGQWIPGYMEKGVCFIPWKGMEHGYEEHEVLIGAQGSARMKWVRWTAKRSVPRLSVSTSSYYVTRHWDDVTERYVVGELSEENTAAHAFLRGKVNNTLHTGHILTEIEPVKYEIEDLEAPLSSWITLSTTPMELATTQLINPHDTEAGAYATVAYRFTEILEMKRLPGMKPGLMAAFRKTKHAAKDVEDTHVHDILDGRNFIIGLELFHDHGEEMTVTAQVPAKSKVKVTLLANYQTYQIPYKAIVKAYYRDGHSLTWKGRGSITFQTIEGMHQTVAEPEPTTEEDLALALEQTHVQLHPAPPEVTTPQPMPIITTTPPMPKTTTPQPLPVVTTPQPMPIITSPQPLPITTTPEPMPLVTTPQPMPNTTTQQPVPQNTTPQPVPKTTTAQPAPKTTTAQPVPKTTTQQPVPKTTTQQPVPKTTTQQPIPIPYHTHTIPQPVPRTTTPQPVPKTTAIPQQQRQEATTKEEIAGEEVMEEKEDDKGVVEERKVEIEEEEPEIKPYKAPNTHLPIISLEQFFKEVLV